MQAITAIGTNLRDNYALVMDASKNPLTRLPPAQQFQIMTYLALIWTTIFCAAFGSWYWYSQLVLAHLFIILGFVITALTFSGADPRTQSSRRQRRMERITLRTHLAG